MLLLPEESLVLQLVELHVFYVPDELWNPKLNTVSIEAINKFISAGFIRVYPDLTLQTLREQLGEILGEDAITDKFVFLKCVGRSLAVVKARQETQVKLKSFAPPYASQPELYLLPGVVHDGKSSCSLSVTPDRQQYITDYSGLTESSQDPRNPNFSKPESMRDIKVERCSKVISHPKNHRGSDSFGWGEKLQENRTIQTGAQNKASTGTDTDLEEHILLKLKKSASKVDLTKEFRTNIKGTRKGRNSTRDSGVPESLEDKDAEFSKTHNKRSQQLHEDNNSMTDFYGKPTEKLYVAANGPPFLPAPVQYTSPPAPPLLALNTHRPHVPVFQTDKENIIKQLQITRQERKQLEKSREELVKKAKGLLAQNRLRRNQVRDAWKKKYFDTKKGTSSLEEMLNRLRQDQELYYQKLLQHLEARDGKKQPKNLTSAASSKNDLIIQITTEQREVDQLKRKVDNAKMKLVTELKLRKQAATELRALRAELAQKKIQSSLSRKCGGSIPQNLNSVGIQMPI
nr:PREDICTED: spermatogenesis-associated protein 1 isoform X1 [Latimeria chalumnae]|eukprot:XP_005993910.1 PREDICTED: spermatogenesis-associated protein 1 isoform X1 [Latimeria chalumnae]